MSFDPTDPTPADDALEGVAFSAPKDTGDIPPPDISDEDFSSSDVPTFDPDAGEKPSLSETAQHLSKTFGVQAQDDESFTNALRPVLDSLARLGNQPDQPVAPETTPDTDVPKNQGVQSEELEFFKNKLELEGYDDNIVQAFQSVIDESKRAVQAAINEAKAAKAEVEKFSNSQAEARKKSVQHYQQQVARRAEDHVSKLDADKFGTAGNRTVAQQIAANQVFQLAGTLRRGFERGGYPLPPIEDLIDAAILYSGGSLPKPSGAKTPGPAPSTNSVLPVRTPSTPSAPRPPVRSGGSAGAGESLMKDDEFLRGARAILSR